MTAAVNTAPSQRRSAWFWMASVVAGLAYAFLVWSAVAFLLQVAPIGIDVGSWAILLFAVVLPAFVFIAAVSIARSRPLWQYVFALLAGLGLSAVFWLNVLSYMLRSIALG